MSTPNSGRILFQRPQHLNAEPLQLPYTNIYPDDEEAFMALREGSRHGKNPRGPVIEVAVSNDRLLGLLIELLKFFPKRVDIMFNAHYFPEPIQRTRMCKSYFLEALGMFGSLITDVPCFSLCIRGSETKPAFSKELVLDAKKFLTLYFLPPQCLKDVEKTLKDYGIHHDDSLTMLKDLPCKFRFSKKDAKRFKALLRHLEMM